MIRFLPAALGFVALLAFHPAPVGAQGARTWEFGVDLGFNLSMTDNVDDDLITVGLPGTEFGALLQNLRVGYNASDTFENDDFYAGWNITGSVGFSFFTM